MTATRAAASEPPAAAVVPDRPGSALARAEAAVALAQTDPREAVRLAQALAAAHRSDPEVRSVALRAAGLALAELVQPAGALAQLRAAARGAGRGQLPHREGEARSSAAWVLYTMGRTRAALAEADRAGALLDGGSLDRLRALRALIVHRLGRTAEALTGYGAALPGLVKQRDRLWEARLRNNRAVLHAELNEIALARADLLRAGELFSALSMDLAVAQVQHNLGFVAARAGDAVGALQWYHQAEDGFQAVGVPPTVIVLDRAELLISLRLGEDALAAASQAVALCASAGLGASLAEAKVLQAEAAHLVGDAAQASAAAAEAVQAFRRQHRPAWALLAERARLIGLVDGEPGQLRAAAPAATATELGRLLADCRRLARRLDAARWEPLAVDAHVRAARLAKRLDRTAVARAELELAARRVGRLPALTRARIGYAQALRADLDGDRATAVRTLRRAIGIVRDYAATFGAIDLRTGAASYAAELTELGARLAQDAGRPAEVLRWSELGRSLALAAPPAAPPDDAEMARLLSELRQVTGQVRAATTAGRDPRALIRRQARVEAAVHGLTRRARSSAGAPVEPVAAGQLAARLGPHALVSYAGIDGELVAVVRVPAGGSADPGRLRLHRLGSPIDVGREVDALLAALRRLALGYGTAGALRHRRALAERIAQRLDDLLIAPLCLPERPCPVLIVPTGVLHALPWAALPSLSERPVVVTPSATLWAQRADPANPVPDGSTPQRRTVLVAGPDLPGAAAEVAEIAAALPGARTLGGAAATVGATLEALDGSEVGHIACHGQFRPGNPLFSALRLHDGPLTVFDLQRLGRLPPTMVLSACEAGRSEVTAGDGLLGLAATLLSLGARTLVAPLVVVPDATTRTLMVDFHRRLAAGAGPADALYEARAGLPDDAAGYATRAAFVCLGHG